MESKRRPPGTASRQRRMDAISRAKDAAYKATTASVPIVNPFSDERCSRIFDKFVKQIKGL